MEVRYPAHWEADVVLSDGGTAHLRPIRPDDADLLRAFYSRLSEQSIYFRFFGPRSTLSQNEIDWFTNVDYDDRVALIATIGTEMVAVVRYDRLRPRDQAEVAFLVEDAHQGRGVAAMLLEHLRAAAGERGIKTFIADVLPANHRMTSLLRQAGYLAHSQFEDGVVRMILDLATTDSAAEVTSAREHRSEARSIERLLRPTSVAVIGASREPGGIGQTVLRNLLAADFSGPVYPVHREVRAVAGVRAYRNVSAIDGDVDLAVLAIPAESVIDVVEECAAKGVKGLVVVSSGFGETGPEGLARQEELVRIARAYGLRVVGPNCLGIANTDPSIRLNATLAATLPERGTVGFFSQSGDSRHGAAPAGGPARHGPVVVRLRRQPGRRVGQRPAPILGGGSVDRRDPALPGVIGKPTQVLPAGAAHLWRQADRGGQEQGSPHGARRAGARPARHRPELALRAVGGDPGG